MAIIVKRRPFTRATQIFDVEDQFARMRGVQGLHPRPIGPIKFYLVGQMVNGVRQNFDPPFELLVKTNPSGYHLFFGRVKREKREDLRTFVGRAGDAYIVRVESRYYQPQEIMGVKMPMSQPNKAIFIDLAPSYAYPFPPGAAKSLHAPTLLRGSVVGPDQAGIAGVQIQDLDRPTLQYLTDQSGQWALAFPDELFPKPAMGQATLTARIRFSLASRPSQEKDVDLQQGNDLGLPPIIFAV